MRLSEESLHAAGEQVRRLQDFARRLKLPVAPKDGGRLAERVAEVRHAYREALDDDLNLPQGLGHVFELLREANAALDSGEVGEAAARELLLLMADVDAHADVSAAQDTTLAAEVEQLIAQREAARKARDFAAADRIRDELRDRGIALEDSKEGVRWRRVAKV